MNTRLYLHIGAHKTASTTIQRAFGKEREALASHGLLYPESNRYHHAQHRLAFALKKHKDPARGDVPDLQEEVAELRAEIAESGCSRIFLSSEALFVCSEERLRRLRTLLAPIGEIRIVAFVRRQDSYLLSLYDHNARMVGNDFRGALKHHVEKPRGISKEISFLRWLQSYAHVFGQDRVHLLRYEDGDPLAAVLDLLDLPRYLVSSSARANTAYPAMVTEVVRLAKLLDLSPAVQNRARRIAGRLFSGWPKHRLTEGQRARILSEFSEENHRMFEMFGMENTYDVCRVVGQTCRQ